MAQKFDLASTFLQLDDAGHAEPIAITPAFWGSRAAGRYARLVGSFDFEKPGDLHETIQEMHPEADEVIYLASGALDVLLDVRSDARGAEQRIALEAGEATIVPRGVWHRLVMRRPGRLVFINSRAGMQSRPRRSPADEPAIERT